jgi:hypothetical protein
VTGRAEPFIASREIVEHRAMSGAGRARIGPGISPPCDRPDMWLSAPAREKLVLDVGDLLDVFAQAHRSVRQTPVILFGRREFRFDRLEGLDQRDGPRL